MWKKHLTFAFFVFVLLTGVVRSASATMYAVEDLGNRGGGTYGWRINESGDVAITGNDADGNNHGCANIDDTFYDCGTLGGWGSRAFGVNDGGQVAGVARDASSRFHAYVWDTVSGIQELGVGDYSWAWDINNAGTVVGTNHSVAFVWDSVNGTTSLDTLGGHSQAYMINGSGLIAGVARDSGDIPHAVIWDTDLVIHDLGTLGGPDAGAWGVNDAGQVVGGAMNADEQARAFIWDETNGIHELGYLTGWNSSWASDVNAGGAAVGSGYNTWSEYGPTDGRAALFMNGTTYDLNDMIPADSGWVLIGAYGINDYGQISGWGYLEGEVRAFRLSSAPVPEPISLVFFGTGMVAVLGFVARRKMRN